MMKRFIAVILCALFVLSLAACGQNTATDSNEPPIVQKNITDSDEMTTIESAIGTLYYPKKWDGRVDFAGNDEMIEATCGEAKLFALYFDGDQGDVYGTLTLESGNIALRYELFEIDDEAENAEDLYAMQEDINVIFQYLIDEGKLTA